MALTPRQLIDQATRHAIHLEGRKTSAVKEYEELLERMLKATRAELDGSPTAWSRQRLERMLGAIRGALRDVGTQITGLMRDQINQLAAYEAGFEARSLGNVVEAELTVPPDTQVRAAVYARPMEATGPYQGQLLEPFIEGWPERTVQRVDGAVRLAFARGQTTDQLVRNLGATMDVSRRDLRTVARTGLQHAASVAREQTWQANDDIVKKVRIVATLDTRTSTICRSLDGREFELDKGPRPPFHPNCRTTTVGVLDERFKLLDEGGQRAARDPKTGRVERVPAGQTYYDWLKNQPAAVQNDVLGPTRAKLMREGGISSERFAELQLNKQFKPLTLSEMEQLEPVAFTRADVDV